MNLSKLKNFAQSARNDLRLLVSGKIEQLITDNSEFSRAHPDLYSDLKKDVEKLGKDILIDIVAYCWFNRFIAFRYMDVKGYTPSKVVSTVEGETTPQILSDAISGIFDYEVITDTKAQEIRALLQSDSQSLGAHAEVYRQLFLLYCKYYNKVMPFMFQKTESYSEYLLPSDLLSTDSILHKFRTEITDDDCQSVEVIGWLYQYYITEKKDQVFADLKKNIKIEAESIPAATQLFTPEWIVRYLVDNSLGRLWLLNYPDSSIKEYLGYYVNTDSHEQEFLHIEGPEEIKICDPSCGSAHMLVYAFDVLFKIYEECSYSRSEIPYLILQKNLFGIEIDERAAELASFALLMKAREYDRRIFDKNVYPNICILKNIHFNSDDLALINAVVGNNESSSDLEETLKQFEHANNYGSLIIPKLKNPLQFIDTLRNTQKEDLFLQHTITNAIDVLNMADFLSKKYHVVVTNPPYMGSKGMNSLLNNFVKENYLKSKSDLCICFIERCYSLATEKAFIESELKTV